MQTIAARYLQVNEACMQLLQVACKLHAQVPTHAPGTFNTYNYGKKKCSTLVLTPSTTSLKKNRFNFLRGCSGAVYVRTIQQCTSTTTGGRLTASRSVAIAARPRHVAHPAHQLRVRIIRLLYLQLRRSLPASAQYNRRSVMCPRVTGANLTTDSVGCGSVRLNSGIGQIRSDSAAIGQIRSGSVLLKIVLHAVVNYDTQAQLYGGITIRMIQQRKYVSRLRFERGKKRALLAADPQWHNSSSTTAAAAITAATARQDSNSSDNGNDDNKPINPSF